MELVLQLCWKIADAYLAALRDINTRVDQLEGELRRALRNEAVLGLLQQQKSLTYFATGMKSNELMLERFESTPQAQLDAAGNELLAEVRIEMRQAIEMVDIAYSVLSDMMDAFASIVSNNLNSVMKMLTSVTILLAVPTLVASIYGMNVDLPGERSAGTFTWILVGCGVLCAALWLFFPASQLALTSHAPGLTIGLIPGMAGAGAVGGSVTALISKGIRWPREPALKGCLEHVRNRRCRCAT